MTISTAQVQERLAKLIDPAAGIDAQGRGN